MLTFRKRNIPAAVLFPYLLRDMFIARNAVSVRSLLKLFMDFIAVTLKKGSKTNNMHQNSLQYLRIQQ